MSQSDHSSSSSKSSGKPRERTGNSSLGDNRARPSADGDDNSNVHSVGYTDTHRSNRRFSFNGEPDDLIPSDMAIPSNTYKDLDNPNNTKSGRLESEFGDTLEGRTKGNRYRTNPRKLNLFKNTNLSSEIPGGDFINRNHDKGESDSSDSDSFLSDDYSVTTDDILEEIGEIKNSINRLNDHMLKMSRLMFEEYENTNKTNKIINSRTSSLEKLVRSGQGDIVTMLEDFRKTTEQHHISVLSHLIVTSGVLFMKKNPGAEVSPAASSLKPEIQSSELVGSELVGSELVGSELVGSELVGLGENKKLSENIGSSQPIGKDLAKMLFDSLGVDELRSLLRDKLSQDIPADNTPDSDEDISNPKDETVTTDLTSSVPEVSDGSDSDSDQDQTSPKKK
jgi:hypothetical protein